MMEMIENLLGSELFVQLLASVIAAVWIASKSTGAIEWLKERKLHIVLEAVEVGVERTYKAYVKQMRAGGQWDDTAKREALEHAKRYALEYAKHEGIDALKVVTDYYLEVLIEDVIRQRKSEALKIQ